MCIIEELNAKIIRCQGQIAQTFENDYMFENHDYLIVREGFQRSLKFLLNERRMHTTDPMPAHTAQTNGTRALLPNQPTIAIERGRSFIERALQAHHFTIQQIKRHTT